jgi:site-specific DNA-methyltransferase (adenine-specific)
MSTQTRVESLNHPLGAGRSITRSNTYPERWTEAQRKEAFEALSEADISRLRQEWETPPDFWQAVDDVYDFQIDVCAHAENAKVPCFIGWVADALDLWNPWIIHESSERLRAWCNPGFSSVLPWHQRAFIEAQKHPSAIVAVIGIPGASQEWYAFAQAHADEIIHLASRVNYLAPWPIKQTNNNRESVLYIYRRKVVPTRPAVHTLWDWEAQVTA